MIYTDPSGIKTHFVYRKDLASDINNLRKGKVFGKHRLDEKKTTPVLLKLFINGNERRHTTEAPT